MIGSAIAEYNVAISSELQLAVSSGLQMVISAGLWLLSPSSNILIIYCLLLGERTDYCCSCQIIMFLLQLLYY